ncbi:MAG: DUF6036 family nucleotidyltransferase [Blastocatellia bacterium]
MLNPDFKDMLLCLQEEKVEFLLVGAYAIAAHGNPRATGDLDLWIKPDPDNGRRVIRALQAFSAPTSGLSVDDFVKDDTIVQIGVVPCRIDLITGIEAVRFDEAWENRVTASVDGLTLFVISKADMLKNKLALNRDKDKSDIAWLQKNLD